MTIWRLSKRREAAREEREQMERLDRAEDDLRVLQRRAQKANKVLSSRQSRNHWRESVEAMILGGRDG